MQRVYIDTSVIGGCLDEEFKDDSVKLFNEFVSGIKTAVISDILLFELKGAPAGIQDILRRIPSNSIEYVSLDRESFTLAEAYIKERAVAEKSISDARHIAIATVARVDVLVSWNFKHIVNINRIHLFNAVNLKLGYPIIEIRSPKEILYER